MRKVASPTSSARYSTGPGCAAGHDRRRSGASPAGQARGDCEERRGPRGECPLARASSRRRRGAGCGARGPGGGQRELPVDRASEPLRRRRLRPISLATCSPTLRPCSLARAACPIRRTSGRRGRAIYQTGHGAAYDVAGLGARGSGGANPVRCHDAARELRPRGGRGADRGGCRKCARRRLAEPDVAGPEAGRRHA